MGADPTHQDKALLERLNALKQSSISFQSSQSHQSPRSPTDDLTARFRTINNARRNDPDALTKAVAESIDSREEDAPPSPTVEELLADLGPEEQWDIDGDEKSQIQSLLKEAKEALPSDQEAEDKSSVDGSKDTVSPPQQNNANSGNPQLAL
ncbi:hypothetical protein Q9189_005132 [Teloschistes chrysophthalmus]